MYLEKYRIGTKGSCHWNKLKHIFLAYLSICENGCMRWNSRTVLKFGYCFFLLFECTFQSNTGYRRMLILFWWGVSVVHFSIFFNIFNPAQCFQCFQQNIEYKGGNKIIKKIIKQEWRVLPGIGQSMYLYLTFSTCCSKDIIIMMTMLVMSTSAFISDFIISAFKMSSVFHDKKPKLRTFNMMFLLVSKMGYRRAFCQSILFFQP